jgi:NAD(P)-dependent dehydrogenase (short-subunit alcohol dehydrogenase family)
METNRPFPNSQNSKLFGQTAVISGGADGLGFSVAQHLVAHGARVALLDLSNTMLEQARSKLAAGTLIARVDVTDQEAVQTAIASIVKETGRIDMLVNAAGITGRTGIKSHEVEMADFDKVMRVNLNGSLITFQAVIPHMLQKGYGRVLHFASISGKEGNAGMLAYSTSKAAVIGMTKVQGKEYAGTGITVNAIAPAVIFTEMVAKMPEQQVKYMTDKIPMARCGTKEEVASLCGFILSPNASFTTGFTFDLSGGRATY